MKHVEQVLQSINAEVTCPLDPLPVQQLQLGCED